MKKVSYQREALIDEIMCDLLNGMSRFQIKRKLEEQQYENQEKTFSHNVVYKFINEALERCKLELKENRDEQRTLMYSRILSIYEDAVSAGDRSNALKALDQMTKLIGLNDPDKVEVNANVRVKKVRVKFGVSVDDDVDDAEYQEVIDIEDEETETE